MKYATPEHTTTRQNKRNARLEATDGQHANSIAPPAYGLDFVDQGPTNLTQGLVNRGQGTTVQAKLMVGGADTASEREADQVAERVLDSGSVGGGVSPVRGPGLPVDASVERGIGRARGGGRPLPDKTRDRMERSLGIDLSGVRVHAGGSADRLNRELGAKAFTSGSDVFFRQGAFQPGTRGGQELLAHELTHVVQQGAAGGSDGVVQRYLVGRGGSALSVKDAVRQLRQKGVTAEKAREVALAGSRTKGPVRLADLLADARFAMGGDAPRRRPRRQRDRRDVGQRIRRLVPEREAKLAQGNVVAQNEVKNEAELKNEVKEEVKVPAQPQVENEVKQDVEVKGVSKVSKEQIDAWLRLAAAADARIGEDDVGALGGPKLAPKVKAEPKVKIPKPPAPEAKAPVPKAPADELKEPESKYPEVKSPALELIPPEAKYPAPALRSADPRVEVPSYDQPGQAEWLAKAVGMGVRVWGLNQNDPYGPPNEQPLNVQRPRRGDLVAPADIPLLAFLLDKPRVTHDEIADGVPVRYWVIGQGLAGEIDELGINMRPVIMMSDLLAAGKGLVRNKHVYRGDGRGPFMKPKDADDADPRYKSTKTWDNSKKGVAETGFHAYETDTDLLGHQSGGSNIKKQLRERTSAYVSTSLEKKTAYTYACKEGGWYYEMIVTGLDIVSALDKWCIPQYFREHEIAVPYHIDPSAITTAKRPAEGFDEKEKGVSFEFNKQKRRALGDTFNRSEQGGGGIRGVNWKLVALARDWKRFIELYMDENVKSKREILATTGLDNLMRKRVAKKNANELVAAFDAKVPQIVSKLGAKKPFANGVVAKGQENKLEEILKD